MALWKRAMTDRIDDSIAIVERPAMARSLPHELQVLGARVFTVGQCLAVVCKEPTGWHISISKKDRDPSWDEIVTARYRLLPHVDDMVMHLPRLTEYVNLQKHTFHLHELKAT